MESSSHAVAPGPPLPPGTRVDRGVGAGLLTMLVAALPLMYAMGESWGSFRGCLLACPIAPRPGAGVVWAAVSAVLVAVPVGVGLRAAGVRPRSAWIRGAALVPLVLGALFLLAYASGNVPTP